VPEEKRHTYVRLEVVVRAAMFDEDGECINGDIVGTNGVWMQAVGGEPTLPQDLPRIKEALTRLAVGTTITTDRTLEANGYSHMPGDMAELILVTLVETGEQTTRLVNAEMREKDGKRRLNIYPVAPDQGNIH
jgi:hypothetical protein